MMATTFISRLSSVAMLMVIAAAVFVNALPAQPAQPFHHQVRRNTFPATITFPSINFYGWLLSETSYRSIEFASAFAAILDANGVVDSASAVQSASVSTNVANDAAIITIACYNASAATAVQEYIDTAAELCVPIDSVNYNLCKTGNHFYDPLQLSTTESTTTNLGNSNNNALGDDDFFFTTIASDTESSEGSALSGNATLLIGVAGGCVVVIALVAAVMANIKRKAKAEERTFSDSDFASTTGSSSHTAFSSALSGASFDMGTLARSARLGIYAKEIDQEDPHDHSSMYRHSVVNTMRTLSGRYERGENGQFRKAKRKQRDKLRLETFKAPALEKRISVVDDLGNDIGYDVADYSDTASTPRTSNTASPINVSKSPLDKMMSSEDSQSSLPPQQPLLNVKSSGNLMKGKAKSHMHKEVSNNKSNSNNQKNINGDGVERRKPKISLNKHNTPNESKTDPSQLGIAPPPQHQYYQFPSQERAVLHHHAQHPTSHNSDDQHAYEVMAAVKAKEVQHAKKQQQLQENRSRYSVSLLSDRSSFSSRRVLDDSDDPYDLDDNDDDDEEEVGEYGKYNFLSGQYRQHQKEKQKVKFNRDLQHHKFTPNH
eukprot:m.63012 g.63012  ORF g.63012 m.63012 type:complete len:603 (+) comp11426_c1_seq2:636-2444(+)